jgi:hypothetical protein
LGGFLAGGAGFSSSAGGFGLVFGLGSLARIDQLVVAKRVGRMRQEAAKHQTPNGACVHDCIPSCTLTPQPPLPTPGGTLDSRKKTFQAARSTDTPHPSAIRYIS